jgi:phage terminase large subunit-like protein
MSMAQMAFLYPEFSGICFRRSYTDLVQPGALLDRAQKWWLPAGVRWAGSKGQFIFPNGARVAMSYLWGPNDHLRYQGAEYHATAWDELTQWTTPAQYEYVGISRVRRRDDCKIPLRTLCTSNPGGPGHMWVKTMFVGGVDESTGTRIKPKHLYVPASLKDNPYLDRESYSAGLAGLHPTVREQLLNGDWDARDPGDYFRSEWFGPLLDPETDKWPSKDSIRIRWWDLAASEKPDAARTAGVLMARHRSGVRAIEHCKAFRATPGKRDDLIVQTAQTDGHGVVVGLEIEGGSGGMAQFVALEKRLRMAGFKVAGARPAAQLTQKENLTLVGHTGHWSGKAQRADPVASCLERGYQRRGEGANTGAAWYAVDATKDTIHQSDGIRIFKGAWTQAYLDELTGFPDGALCDVVDATTGAWAWLEAHPISGVGPIELPTTKKFAIGHDAHPEERDDSPQSKVWKPL